MRISSAGDMPRFCIYCFTYICSVLIYIMPDSVVSVEMQFRQPHLYKYHILRYLNLSPKSKHHQERSLISSCSRPLRIFFTVPLISSSVKV